MVDLQRYVSNELSHFVGKDKSDEDRYQLLLRILRTGLLMVLRSFCRGRAVVKGNGMPFVAVSQSDSRVP